MSDEEQPEFALDVMVFITLYVKADSEEAAVARLRKEIGTETDPKKQSQGLEISSKYIRLDDDLEMSPAMTVYGWKDSDVEEL